ncbi:MAG: hypothetical protein QHH30_11405, partial [candidate division NC10 bacterium]|nr:hypothetical protein [candidate division NC10 bacterium]
AMKMRYRGGPFEPKEKQEPEKQEAPPRREGEVRRPAGRLGDLVVEVANITIAAIFLYRRIKNLLGQEKPGMDKGLGGSPS